MIDTDKALTALQSLGVRLEHLLNLMVSELKDQSERIAALERANKPRP